MPVNGDWKRSAAQSLLGVSFGSSEAVASAPVASRQKYNIKILVFSLVPGSDFCRVPSSVSVVATDEMVEAARIPTCVMPHGSRLNPAGTRQYSACMMDDLLVEIDTGKFAVSRRFVLFTKS